jgi:hypothetical protein
VFGNAFDIGLFKPRRMVFATVGAFQTIDVGEGFFVKGGQLFNDLALIGPF